MPSVGAIPDLGQRVRGGLLGGRVDQHDLAALDMGGRLAVGDHDDLLVRRRLPREHAPRQPQAGVDIGEVLRDSAGRVVEVEPQVDPAVEHAHRLGRRVDELPLVHQVGERVEADHLQRVLRVARPHHRLKRQRDLLGRVILAVPVHRAAHVDQDDRRTPRLVLGLVHDVVFRLKPDRHAAALADVGILDRLVQVRDWPASRRRHRAACLRAGPCPRPFPAVSWRPSESRRNVWNRSSSDRSWIRRTPRGVTRHWPSSILLDQAFLLDQLDDLRHLVFEVVHVAQDALAVLHQIFGELVEDLVGRLRQELLRAVPLGVFK